LACGRTDRPSYTSAAFKLVAHVLYLQSRVGIAVDTLLRFQLWSTPSRLNDVVPSKHCIISMSESRDDDLPSPPEGPTALYGQHVSNISSRVNHIAQFSLGSALGSYERFSGNTG
jgi:hypothetical protein